MSLRPGTVFLADCPARLAIEIVAGKWAVVTLFALSNGPLRHGELVELVGGVSRKVLTQTLRRLQENGLVERRAYAEAPPRVEYSLTELGRTLEGSWPMGVVPPTEGGLDREAWNRLIAVLTRYRPAGSTTRCLAYDNPLLLGAVDFDNLHVLTGRLGDAEVLYDHCEAGFSPSNLWADDRSWVLCTDYDLWATKIAGPPALINALLNDSEIEAVRLPWAH